MNSQISDSQVRAGVAGRHKKQRRIALAGVLILIVIAFILKPPFVVRPLPGANGSGNGGQPVESAAAKFVDPIWTSKVLPVFEEKAEDITKVVPEIRTNPDFAGQKYGRREATNPYNYMVKGTGKVTEIKSESQAGTAIVEVPGLNEKVAIQIGPVVRGTALRDATGIVSFNQFSNQLDYADVSKEMNGRALKSAFANATPASLAGKTVTFFGAFTFDPHSKSPILITPVKIAL
jgi:predicted lipoprotein